MIPLKITNAKELVDHLLAQGVRFTNDSTYGIRTPRGAYTSTSMWCPLCAVEPPEGPESARDSWLGDRWNSRAWRYAGHYGMSQETACKIIGAADRTGEYDEAIHTELLRLVK